MTQPPNTELLALIGTERPAMWTRRLLRALVQAGYDTPEQVAAASDEELLAVHDIGAASVAYLRDRLTRYRQPPPPPPTPRERLAAGIEAELRRYLGGSARP
ncbi:hypothetical protein [Nonomuraea sp. 10N515B]|uniref:hypothetical protein n=1 Tax=Nonomuraea sp. 10N515B TaxID=3457422 RepID=UPI003FCCBBF5